MKKKVFLTLVVAVGLFVGYLFAEAQQPTLQYSPPCPLPNDTLGECVSFDSSSAEDISANNLANYIRRIYQFAVAISGMLALGMIVVGGIYISISAGSPDKQKEGREMIVSAIWGIVLILGSYLILRTVNPRLVELPTPEIERVKNLGRYSLARFECPTAGNTGCFFDDDGNACDFQDPNVVCNAVEKASPACGENAPYRCACKNCQLLSESFYPIKASACSGEIKSSTLGKCMLEENVLSAFDRFYDDLRTPSSLGEVDIPLGTGSGEWRVTEVFPPTVPHISRSHYNGTSFDFSKQDIVYNEVFCEETERVARTAADYFRTVYIEFLPTTICPNLNESSMPREVRRLTASTASAFHLHVEGPK